MRIEFRIVIPRFCIDVKNAESRAVAVVFKCLFVIGGAGVVFHNEIFAEQGRLFVDSRRDNGDFFAVSQRGFKRRQRNGRIACCLAYIGDIVV